jgi:hypothetical protein
VPDLVSTNIAVAVRAVSHPGDRPPLAGRRLGGHHADRCHSRFASLPAPDELLAAIGAAQPCYHDDVHGSPAWREATARQFAVEVLAELAAA